MTIIRDAAGNHFIAKDAGPGLEHAYLGIPAKRTGGTWAAKAGAKERLVRRVGTVVVGELLAQVA